MQISFTQMHPVYGNKCFQSQQYTFSVKNARGQKFASDTKMLSVVFQRLGQQPASFFAMGIQKLVNRWDKC